MSDWNEVIRRLTAQKGDTNALRSLLEQQSPESLSRAAQAAQQGDLQQAQQLAQALLQTAEGRALYEKLQQSFRNGGAPNGK